MQEFLQKSSLREAMDEWGFRLGAGALCFLWFFFLWGVTLPSMLSALALWALTLLLRRKTRDGRLKRREKALRRRIGGEMAVERLLLLPPRRAHFETAALLSRHCPLTPLWAGEGGALCRLRDETVLVSLCQRSPSSSVGPDDVLACQRAARTAGAGRGILCAPCGVGAAASLQAEGPVPVSFLSRDTLISLFGRDRPVTDAELVSLGKRKKRRPAGWLKTVLQPRLAGRYAGYGTLLLAMYLLTGFLYYAAPGLVCLSLAAACRCVRPREEIL